MIELNHEGYTRQAITLVAHVPERPFAAIIVDSVTGEVIAEGWTRSDHNPTWHGKIDAINRLIAMGKTGSGMISSETSHLKTRRIRPILWLMTLRLMSASIIF